MTENQDGKSASNGKAEVLKILTENLAAGAKVAKRLLWSCERVAHLLPPRRRAAAASKGEPSPLRTSNRSDDRDQKS